MPSVLLGVVAISAGIWVVGHDERRLGWGAIAAGVIGAGGAVAATRSGAGHLEDVVTWSALFAAMLRFATPLIFGALGGIVSERSGVVNIGIEGMMLMGCYFGIYGADIGGSWVVGLLVAAVAGGALALVHAVFSVTLRADQIVGGVAINLLALGITGYLYVDHYGDQGTPDNISRVPDVTLPLIKDIPFVGDAIGKANLLTWLALLMVVALAVFLFRTPRGLRLRSIGEHPRAAETVGLSVIRTRYLAVIASGVFAALGGAYLSIGVPRLVQPEPHRGPRLHRARGRDLRPVAAGRRARVRVSVRLLERARATAAGVLGVGCDALPSAAVRPDDHRRRRA